MAALTVPDDAEMGMEMKSRSNGSFGGGMLSNGSFFEMAAFIDGLAPKAPHFARVGNVVDNIMSFLPPQSTPKMRLVCSFWNYVALGTDQLKHNRKLVVANRAVDERDKSQDEFKRQRFMAVAVGLTGLISAASSLFGLLEGIEHRHGQVGFGLAAGVLLPVIVPVFAIFAGHLKFQNGFNMSIIQPMLCVIYLIAFITIVFGAVGMHHLGQYNQFSDAAERPIFRAECDTFALEKPYPSQVEFFDPGNWEFVARADVNRSPPWFSDTKYTLSLDGGGVSFHVLRYKGTHYPSRCNLGYTRIRNQPEVRISVGLANILKGGSYPEFGIQNLLLNRRYITVFKEKYSGVQARDYRRNSYVPIILNDIENYSAKASYAFNVFAVMFAICVFGNIVVLLCTICCFSPSKSVTQMMRATETLQSIRKNAPADVDAMVGLATDDVDDEDEEIMLVRKPSRRFTEL